MKLNKKIIFPAFALLAGVSLVGSISGTVAWYQYSTRANASYIGSSAGVIGNLQVRLPGGEWGPQVRTDDVLDYLAAEGIYNGKVEPITPGALGLNDSLKEAKWNQVAVATAGDVAPDNANGNNGDYYYYDGVLYLKSNDAWAYSGLALADPGIANANVGDKYFDTASNKVFEKVLADKDFYLNPQFGVASYSNWLKASKRNYVRIPLELQFIQGDALTAQNVYLSKLRIQKDTLLDNNAADHGDISDAVRVHFSVYEDGDEENANNFLVSKKGGTTLTHGKLRLGNGVDFDRAFDDGDDWGFGGSDYDYIDYGAGQQVSYVAADADTVGYKYEEEALPNGFKEVALLTGDDEPAANVGNNGDFFYDSVHAVLYKKAAGAWAEFNAYFSGTANLALTDLENANDYYLKTDENKLFVRAAEKENISSILVSQQQVESNPLELTNIAGKALGSTVATANPQNYLHVDVTIWVEGWQKLNNGSEFSSLWNADLIGAWFDVGMQFAVQDLNA